LLTATTADLHWTDNSPNELGFVVERCVGTAAFCGANPTSFVPLPPTGANVTSLADSGLLPGTTYSWRVRAFNAVGTSAYSNTLSATTLTGPAAPTNLRATYTLRVVLAWVDNASDETGYTIERCTGAGCTGFAPIAHLEGNAFRYADPTAAPGTTYRYRVAATGPGGQSPYSNVVAVTTR
jgi:predicted phage tail protein